MNNETLQKIGVQLGSVLLTALVAAGIAAIQSIASSNGLTCSPTPDPAAAGAIGAAIRGAVAAIQLRSAGVIT